MLFEHVIGAFDGYGDDGAAGFFCDLHAAFFEFQHLFGVAAGAFGVDPDGGTVFHLLYAGKDGFQSLLEVLTVQEEAGNLRHPLGENGEFGKLDLGYVATGGFQSGVAYGDVEVAAVVADEEDRFFGDVFFAKDGDFGTGDEEEDAACPLGHAEGDAVVALFVFFVGGLQDEKDGIGEDQV